MALNPHFDSALPVGPDCFGGSDFDSLPDLPPTPETYAPDTVSSRPDVVKHTPPPHARVGFEMAREDRAAVERLTGGPFQLVPPGEPDLVNHPAHYNQGKIEVIDFLEDQKLGHHEATAVAYVCRARHKGTELQDLRKAVWYLNRRIALLAAQPGHAAAARRNAVLP